MSEFQIIDASLAEAILVRIEEVVADSPAKVPVHFEELTAEPGPLPRLMLKPLQTSDRGQTYISGETLLPFPCSLTLRVAAVDEQDRLDASAYLTEIAQAFLARALVLDGYVAYRHPVRSMITCLGRTSAFEDWQVTFDLYYKQTTTN